VGTTGANGQRPRGRDAVRTREMVLEGAMAEFTAKGFAGARIDAVAERAGVNVRSIYQHFESKAALFDAVLGDSVHRRHEQLLADIAGLFDGAGGLAEVFPLFRRVLADNPGWVRLMAWKELSEDVDVDLDEIFAAADRQALYRREIALFDAARDRGHIPGGLDSDLMLIALTALAAFPWFVRPLTLLVTGQAPESPEFRARWDAFLLAVGRALAGADSAGGLDGAEGAEPAAVPGPVSPRLHRELRMMGRALDRAGLAGPFGHCSRRVDDDTFLVTPPHPLRVLTTRACTAVPIAGPLPVGVLPQVRLDQAIYRARPDLGAIATVEPASVTALAMAGRGIAEGDPGAAYFGPGPARHDGPESPEDDNGAAALAAALGARAALVRPGGGAVVVGETPAQALALAVFLEQACAAALLRPCDEQRVSGPAPGWAERRAERMWEYLTAGDAEAAAPA
jgi:HCOMODA/2-hydroxy-3-carboxy-muconic semialdehyde decarboxylase